MEYKHRSVLLLPAVEGLAIRADGVYADCTAGGGGHSLEIAKRLGEGGRLYCFDRDPEAIAAAKKRLAGYSPVFIRENFSDAKAALSAHGVFALDGALLDLGVSSYQLDNPARGFSFHEDAPLDMRMSGEGLSARDVVNEYEGEALERILFDYGEEKYARGIVKGILAAREKAPIETTGELAEIIKNNVPLKVRREKNPCRKTFQAIRIEVNRELDALETALGDLFDLLKPGGRIAVITFHSLEDRIVKLRFRSFCEGCVCPKDFPVCVCGKKPRALAVTRKPIVPDEDELSENPRSRSAKLRIIEKI
ncbi:MAG: 16S rRNA (cytosine(1402)-N(4))-methyltransferase RsmH [Bacteroides sp.]|nr:16S rRNA (cytosine(1402)-N(4))-methyltransferase RsmH [Eubacterium sp.]MCM1418330.1 16S rRNA (cytosine(1402)-N(4))-methyltransferase RsmH [Roseburia sp.]MCM1463395.1 16S rRNA (cytosine(1402)-N(4))-methyltransferase RsmH [Bacteroides sp.]